MKLMMFTFLILFSQLVSAQTSSSKLVSYIQSKYAQQSKKYPILIFDKDEVHYRFAKSNVFGDSKDLEKKRIQIVKKYVIEKSGVDLTDSEASNLETYLTALKEGAFALPLNQGGMFKNGYKICAVFPAMPNSNQRLETERLLQLQNREAFGDLDYHHLTQKMDYQTMKLFSIYHELGHCLDPKFLPSTYNSYSIDPHSVHLSESFAETLGLHFLEKEGVKGAASQRTLYRNLYSHKVGRWFVDNPQAGFGNELYLYGGIIYYLVPVLEAAQKILERGVLDNSIESMINQSTKVVEENALDFRTFRAVYQAFENGEEAAIAEYTEKAESMPDYFGETVGRLKKMLNRSKELVSQMIDDRQLAHEHDNSLPEEIRYKDLCHELKLTNSKVIFATLEKARMELVSATFSPELQRKRQIELNSFFNNLASTCNQ